MLVYDLKNLGTNKVSFYLALEQLLLANLDEDIFFLWDISKSIVIGRNQLLAAEVNLDYTLAHNIPLYRRPSGGGAIYADDGCFMYSFLTKEKNKDLVNKTYSLKIQEILSSLGLDIVFSGRNDLLFHGKKFSGTAIYQNEYGTILHGTFLYDTDIAPLVKSLTVDATKLISKGIKSVKERVINLKPYLNVSKEELMTYLGQKMARKTKTLTQEELKKVLALEQKYLSYDWIYGLDPKYSLSFKQRFSYGSLEVFLLIKNNKVISQSLKGDFFTKQDLDSFNAGFINKLFNKQEFIKVLANNSLSNYIYDAVDEDFINMIFMEEV